jgi:hypothetical protein
MKYTKEDFLFAVLRDDFDTKTIVLDPYPKRVQTTYEKWRANKLAKENYWSEFEEWRANNTPN